MGAEKIIRWYKKLALIPKIIVSFFAFLFCILIVYVGIRSFIYFASSGTNLLDLQLEDADILVQIRNLEDVIKESEGLKLFRGLGLEDKLKQTDLNQIMRFIRDEFAISVKKEGNREKFFASTRIGYLDFLLLPIVELFPGIIKARNEGGILYIPTESMAITFQGNVALVSNDPNLLKRNFVNKEGVKQEKRVYIKLRSSDKYILEDLKVFLPQLTNMQWIEIGLDLKDGIFDADLQVQLKRTLRDINISNYVVQDAIFVGTVPVNGLELWKWLRKQVTNKQMSELLNEIAASGIELEFFSYLRDGFGLVARSQESVGLRKGRFVSACIIINVEDPVIAFNKLDNVMRKIFGNFGQFYKDGDITYFEYKADPFEVKDMIHPAYAVSARKLFLSNNPTLLKDVLYKKTVKVESVNLKDASEKVSLLLDQSVLFTGFLQPERLYESLTGFAAIAASYASDKERTSIRAKKRAELAAIGRFPSETQLDEIVREELRRLARQEELRLVKRLEILKSLKWIAFVVDDGKLILKSSLH